jgi:nitroreductase
MEKYANTNHDVIEPVTKRWSPRSFQDKDVEPDKLAKIFEAARWAASSYNEQPWRYLVASKHRNQEVYEKIFTTFNDFNQSWAKTAPVAGLSFVKTFFGDDTDQENEVALHDVGAASAQMSLQAAELDLYVHQMAGIEPDVIADTFTIPDGYQPVAGFVIGYGDEPDKLPEELAEQERSSRERINQQEFVFSDWGTPADFCGE